MHNIIQIIEKKADKKELTKDEIDFVVKNFANKNITDYQMSSFLMAIRINGMTLKEIIAYTEALIYSGETIEPPSVWVDKHSSGGVGDKVTIILAPLLASMGDKIGKISGRGLGFTGGTIDKLESIPGFNVNLSKEKFILQVEKIGVSVISPLPDLVPADKTIYALRDVTGTVTSIPLIAASIMSKKIAAGTKYIIIDLKVGSGAMMTNIKEAKKLGNIMKMIGKAFDREVFIEFSSMSQPLGHAIGNGIEIKEAIKTLKGNGPNDIVELVTKIAAQLHSKNKKTTYEKAFILAKQNLENDKAYLKFLEWIEAQGGKKNDIEKQKYFTPSRKSLIKANTNGYAYIPNPQNLGWLSIELGAGRKTKNDVLDYNAGFYLKVKNGDKVLAYDTLIEIYSDRELTETFLNQVWKEIKIVKIKPKKEKLILGSIKW